MATPAAPIPPHSELTDADAKRVALARRDLTRLGTDLVSNPLDPQVHDALRAYLARDAAPAVAALEALRARAAYQPDVLRNHVQALVTYLAQRVS